MTNIHYCTIGTVCISLINIIKIPFKISLNVIIIKIITYNVVLYQRNFYQIGEVALKMQTSHTPPHSHNW